MAELKDRMSYPEFQKWQAFYAHEPLGEARLDQATAMIIKAMAAQVGKDIEFEELIPDYWDTPREEEKLPTPEELAAKARLIFGVLNAAKPNR